MPERRHKIPFLLKLKRFKNSETTERINSIFSLIKPAKKYKGKLKSILLIRNDKIGDAVVTLPVIRNLKLNYPDLKIDVLVSGKNKLVFEDFKYADDILEFNWTPPYIPNIYYLPIIGGILQFIRYSLFPYIFSGLYRNKINQLRAKQYDAAVDLVGLFRNAILSMMVSNFSIGPSKLAVHILYDYYLPTNWVSKRDNDFMTNKIETAIVNALGLLIEKRNTSLPLVNINAIKLPEHTYDIIFHLGASKLRKLSPEKEMELLALMKNLKILVTDSHENSNFNNLKNIYFNNDNISFKTFDSMLSLIDYSSNSKLLICYDGGQAHYLSQFIKTITIFGPGSSALWKPFEFSPYSLREKISNGVNVLQSNGKFGHLSIYLPIWCSPCFDVGCKEKPCLNAIEPEFVWEIINKYGFYNDK